MMRLLAAETLVGLVVLIGCGKKSTTITTPDGSKVTVDQQSGQASVTVQGEKGAQMSVTAGRKVTLPKDFPADVPIYAGATPTSVASMPTGQNVALESPDPAAKVLEFYQSQLVKQGWKIEGTVNTPGGSMVTATKEKRQIIVNVITDNGKTVISLVVAKG